MTPTTFSEANITFAKDQPEYLPLPAHYEPTDPQGTVTSCWRLSWRERLSVLFRGRMYLSILTFHTPLQPQLPSTTPPFHRRPSPHV